VGGGRQATDANIIRRMRIACRITELPTEPCALGSTQPLKMSTRILEGVKAAGA
jgi:hypothetical protein